VVRRCVHKESGKEFAVKIVNVARIRKKGMIHLHLGLRSYCILYTPDGSIVTCECPTFVLENAYTTTFFIARQHAMHADSAILF